METLPFDPKSPKGLREILTATCCVKLSVIGTTFTPFGRVRQAYRELQQFFLYKWDQLTDTERRTVASLFTVIDTEARKVDWESPVEEHVRIETRQKVLSALYDFLQYQLPGGSVQVPQEILKNLHKVMTPEEWKEFQHYMRDTNPERPFIDFDDHKNPQYAYLPPLVNDDTEARFLELASDPHATLHLSTDAGEAQPR